MGGAILCVWKGPDGASNGMKSFQKAINTVNESPNLRKLVERYADELTAAGLPDYKVRDAVKCPFAQPARGCNCVFWSRRLSLPLDCIAAGL